MSSPPWRDVIVKSYCHFNINDAGAIKLSPCMPGLGQGFCGEMKPYCFKIRNSKFETISKFKCSKFETAQS